MDLKAKVFVFPISSKENQSELARYSFAFIKGKPLWSFISNPSMVTSPKILSSTFF